MAPQRSRLAVPERFAGTFSLGLTLIPASQGTCKFVKRFAKLPSRVRIWQS
jgi:hypothetical protein